MNNMSRTESARTGVQGIKLKKFEEIVADILPLCTPMYSPLPGPPDATIRGLISSSILENPVFRQKMTLEQNDNYNGSDCEGCMSTKDEDAVPAPEWPFDSLPYEAGVRCAGSRCSRNSSDSSIVTGKINGIRAVRKEWQLKSIMQCVLSMLPLYAFGPAFDQQDSGEKKLRIVDFAGGTGHLSIPLAIMLPRVDVILVDLKRSSLDLALQKVDELTSFSSSDNKTKMVVKHTEPMTDEFENVESNGIGQHCEGETRSFRIASALDPVTVHENELRQSAIRNLYVYHGSISSFAKEHSEFDIGLGLHACGEATDLTLRACGTAKANFIVSPCCVGKLNQTRRNPYIYHATASNEPTIAYPQSSLFRRVIPKSTQFDVLSKAADYSDMQDMHTCRNATRRTAKALVEMDRLLFMKETFGYDEVALSRMDPWEASPKNDIIMGWYHNHEKSIGSPYSRGMPSDSLPLCPACNNDIHTAVSQLLYPPTEDNTRMHGDWTADECQRLKNILLNFSNGSERVLKFPPGQGKKTRKLVHSLAEELKLRHWSEGKKNAEKIVVVAK